LFRPSAQPRSKASFDDEQPTKETFKDQYGNAKNGFSENNAKLITRQKINIDENEDTFHN